MVGAGLDGWGSVAEEDSGGLDAGGDQADECGLRPLAWAPQGDSICGVRQT